MAEYQFDQIDALNGRLRDESRLSISNKIGVVVSNNLDRSDRSDVD